MIPYNKEPRHDLRSEFGNISSFINDSVTNNIDFETVKSFGDEWSKFNSFNKEEIRLIGNEYFDIVDDSMLNESMTVLDVGCGTGRWTKYAASRAKFIEAIDPSEAVYAAQKLLSDIDNVRVTQAEVSDLPFNEGSFDFVFSLGVLHHIPDTKQAMVDSVKMLKTGGYFLVYLYYDFENRGTIFKTVFQLSNLIRKIVCKLPQKLKSVVCDVLTVLIYMPLILVSRFLKKFSFTKKIAQKIPLSGYTNKTFNVIRNDALDRFGTPLEQRFSRKDIKEMMEYSGLKNIIFSEYQSYWHAVGCKE